MQKLLVKKLLILMLNYVQRKLKQFQKKSSDNRKRRVLPIGKKQILLIVNKKKCMTKVGWRDFIVWQCSLRQRNFRMFQEANLLKV